MIIKTISYITFILTSSICLSQNRHIDVLDYNISLTVTDSSNQIYVQENVRVLFTENCSSFTLDLSSLSEDGTGMKVKSVKEYSDTIEFKQSAEQLELIPNHGHTGDEMVYEIVYSGIPKDGLVIGENKFGNRTFFGDNWPNRAHNWFACNDHPSDKATVTFSVTAPSIYKVISNGIKISETEASNEVKTTVYTSEFELPTKVMVVGIADFSVADIELNQGAKLSAWVYPENEQQGFGDMQVATDPYTFFVENIGSYPFEKLANVQSTTRFGGMENAGCIFYDEKAVTGNDKMEKLIAHEIAHQWFGNSASESDWQHLWLSEGFATYFTNLHIEQKYGRDAMNAQLEKDRNKIIKFSKQFKRPLIDTISTNLMQLLNPYAYQKGSWVLHMLRHKIGDDLFWTGIRKYYDTYKYSNASSQDFISIMESMSDHDLSGFFDQWTRRDYHPKLKITSKKRCKGWKLTIDQVQDGDAFETELEVQIHYKNGEKETKVIQLRNKREEHKLFNKNKIEQIIIDPNKNLLFERIK